MILFNKEIWKMFNKQTSQDQLMCQAVLDICPNNKTYWNWSLLWESSAYYIWSKKNLQSPSIRNKNDCTWYRFINQKPWILHHAWKMAYPETNFCSKG